MRQIADFEDAENQRRALSVIPLQVLIDRGQARGTEALSPRDELIYQLLNWFKNEFFHKETSAKGHTAPSAEERRFGAGIVELHQCGTCQEITRFPRYNHSGKLIETRRGRCGEWFVLLYFACFHH
ncbi:hypothetical protein BVRB_021840 [Beta vulgaris subsp. vulgaris]|uniref:Uncharacterized protein n=1 Tax=Beta vulgaris subsp. vulgaris TaxID=3555 RepID=A0A0J8DUA1_BETVV|nr:hypothetical protein BVRB_021840 [Beta vulgaris subsp. vulgaris]